MADRPALLVLRALGLGDFLAAVPAYRALRAAYPDHRVVLAGPEGLGGLAALTGAIDRVLPTGELAPIAWGERAPEIAVDLHGNGPASHRLVERTGAGTVMMYASSTAPTTRGPWWDETEHEVERWCRLVEWWGVPADPRDIRLHTPSEEPLVRGAVIVHPGAASGSRRWFPERFASVARALADDGPVVITGTPPERAPAEEVAARAGLGPDSVLAGRTGILGLAAMVAAARLVISNDTGIAHLAIAYGTPSVTLYGPVSPALWGPPVGSPLHAALWKGAGFRPGDAHGVDIDPRLRQIEVADVLEAVATVLSVGAGGSGPDHRLSARRHVR